MLDDTLNGESLYTKHETVYFKVTLIDPCETSTITPLNGVGEPFDASNNSPVIVTSVYFGQDEQSNGIKVTYKF